MQKFQIKNRVTWHIFGTYAAATARDAIAAMYRDAGCDDDPDADPDIIATPIDTDRVIVARDNAGNETITVVYADGLVIVYDATGDDAGSVARAVCDALADGSVCDNWYHTLHLNGRRAELHTDKVRRVCEFITFDPSDDTADVTADVRAFLVGGH